MALRQDIDTMKSQLAQWDSEINQLNYDVSSAAEAARQKVLTEGREKVEALRKQKDETKKRLDDMEKLARETAGL